MAGATSFAWVMFFIWLVLTVAVHGDGAHLVGAPSPATDCSYALLSLPDCLTFVEEGSTAAKPQKECCSELKEVVKQGEACLCDAFKQGASFGVKLNMTKALALPSSCGISTSHLTNCKIVVAPAPAVASAPSPFGAPAVAALGPSPFSGQTSAAAALWPASVGGLVSAAIALCFYNSIC